MDLFGNRGLYADLDGAAAQGAVPDIGALLAQAQQVQEQILAAQAELERVQVHGTAGGGLVTATVTATGELVGLEISPVAVDPEDTETLADLIVAAVRDANRAAAQYAAQAMGPFSSGIGAFGVMGDLGVDLQGPGGGTMSLPSGH